MSEKKYFIGIIKPVREGFIKNPTKKEIKIMEEHFEYLQGLIKSGELLLAGPTMNEENTFGLYIFECESLDKAKELFNNDPSIKARVQKIIELEPFKLSLIKKLH
ncbi:MAG: YciI family protein [Candidatus Thorarchaeota archaeon]